MSLECVQPMLQEWAWLQWPLTPCVPRPSRVTSNQSSQSVHRLVQVQAKRVTFDRLIQGAQEVSCTVDQKSGDIVLSFESCQMNENSHFVWKRDYKEITEFSKGEIKTEGNV